MGIQHKGLGLWVYNTKDQDYGYTTQRIRIMGIQQKDRDYRYPTQRIRIMGIQHKGSGLWVCNTKDRDYYPAQIYFKNCSLNIFRNISVYSHNFRNNSKLKGRKKTTVIPRFMAFAVNKKLRFL